MSQYIVNKKVRIKSEPTKVWDALTNPEKTKHYFYNCEVKSDWKMGHDITFSGKMFWIIPIEMKGKIIQAEPGKILKYTLKNGKKGDASAGYSIVTDTLTYENGETIVTVQDDVGEGEDACHRMERSEKGWDKILSGLKKEVEEGS